MSSILALIGGEEFARGFENVHAEIIRMVGVNPPHVVFLPTAASHDGAAVAQGWCDKAKRLLTDAGARVSAPLVIDRASADNPDNAKLLDTADMIYLGGGYPHVLIETLAGTRTLAAFNKAVKRGALVAGASAGAMAMAEKAIVINQNAFQMMQLVMSGAVGTPAPHVEFVGGYNLVPHTIVSPHFDRMPAGGKLYTRGLYPKGMRLVGIDEQTALVGRDDAWRVLGKGKVTLGKNGKLKTFRAGDEVTLYD